MPTVWTIVLNYNGKALLRACLESLPPFPNGIEHHILLVDNASSDGSVDFVRLNFPHVEILCNPENLMFAGGNNAGANYAIQQGADYVFILNNDAEIEKNCLETLTNFMERTPQAGGCQPSLCYRHRPDIVASNGCMVCITGKASDIDCGKSWVKTSTEEPRSVLGITGGAMFLRSSAFLDTKGFDEDFEMYFEDVDLSLRMRWKGWELYTVLNAKGLHEVSATTDKLGITRRVYYCERNSYRVVLKNFPRGKALKGFFLGILLAWPVAILGIVRGHPQRAWAVLKGMGVGFKTLVHSILKLRSAAPCPFWDMIREDQLFPPRCQRPPLK